MLFDILEDVLDFLSSGAQKFAESEEGQAYLAASRAKKASDEMDRTLQDMYEMNQSLYDDD